MLNANIIFRLTTKNRFTMTTRSELAEQYKNMIPSGINSLADYIELSFKKYADKPCYCALGQTKTFAEIEAMSAKVAEYVLNHAGVTPGDSIAMQLPNLIRHPIAVYGAVRAGMIRVNTNPLYTPVEMLHQFNDSGATALVILSDLLPKYESIKDKTNIKTVIITSATQLLDNKAVSTSEYACYAQIFERASTNLPTRPHTELTQACILQYTGGTTGVSKGAELSHLNVLANSFQTQERVAKTFKEADELVVCPLPLYHIYAFTVCMMTFFAKGAMTLLIPNPRDIDAFVATLKPHQFSVFAGINTLFLGLCQHPEFSKLDFSKLHLTMSGGTALTTNAAQIWQNTTACTVTEGYGLSETGPVVSINTPGQEVSGSVGKPLILSIIHI